MDPRRRLRNFILVSLVVLCAVMLGVGTISGVKIFAQTAQDTPGTGVQGGQAADVPPGKASISSYAFIAAAIAFGFGAIGAGLAIGNVGAAAMGAVAEKPEIAGQALIFVALAEGLVVFGFITALMILGKV
jgi:V/A-type H+-transporting ATPase subunit K